MQINKKNSIVLARNTNLLSGKMSEEMKKDDVALKIENLLRKSLKEMEKILNKKEDNLKTLDLKIKVFNALVKASQFALQKEAFEQLKEKEIVVPQNLIVGKIEPPKEEDNNYEPIS